MWKNLQLDILLDLADERFDKEDYSGYHTVQVNWSEESLAVAQLPVALTPLEFKATTGTSKSLQAIGRILSHQGKLSGTKSSRLNAVEKADPVRWRKRLDAGTAYRRRRRASETPEQKEARLEKRRLARRRKAARTSV